MTPLDAVGVATFVTWLACGLAGVCLAPRNKSARLLLVAAVLLALSRLAEPLLVPSSPGPAFTLGRTVAEMAFLGGLAAVVGTLATFPDGDADARWHLHVPRAFAIVAVLAPLAQLLGSPTLELGGDRATTQPNPFAVPGLEPVGAAGSALASTELIWIVVGVLVLALRWWRGDAVRRARLRWPLRSILLLALLLLAIVVVMLTGAPPPPEWLFAPTFLVALALFPITLLVGLTDRARTLERRLTESRARLIDAEDDARRRLERDIHDGVQQQLVAVLSLVELASHQTTRDPAQAGRTLREVADQARTAIRDLRELVRGIRPPVLQDSGLVAALETQMSVLPVDVRLDADGVSGRRWPSAVESAAYFVVKEGVTNALKHAPGSPVTVTLTDVSGDLEVRVRDGGAGFTVFPDAGRGLIGLRDRVESLGGAFEVRSGPNHGTEVSARIPPEAEPAR